MRKKKKTSPPPRNRVALSMILNPRRNTGHGDKKKEQASKACRKPVALTD